MAERSKRRQGPKGIGNEVQTDVIAQAKVSPSKWISDLCRGRRERGAVGAGGGVPDMSQLQAHSRYLKQKRVGGNPRGP